MPNPHLPVDVDASYADESDHPDIQIHQQHHDALHGFYNLFNLDDLPDGGIPFWVDSEGEFQIIDPDIAGSPGPTGPPGQGFAWLGVYSGATTYHAYDVVRSGRHVFVARITTTGVAPDSATPGNNASWDLFAQGGVDGAAGSPGNDGTSIIGPAGPAGPSREAAAPAADVSGAYTLDAGVATGYVLTMTDDTTFTLSDSGGSDFSAITLRLYQGAGGPWTGDFPDVVFWNTTDNNPPDFSGLAEGDLTIVVFDQIFGDWVGHSRASSGPPAPDTFPTLDMDTTALVSADQGSPDVTADGTGTAVYTLGTAVQLGSKRGGVVAVMSTRGDSVDPPIPSLQGAGATWVQGPTKIFQVTGTTRRRVTLFFARDASSGAAAAFTITLVSTAGFVSTSCAVLGFRTGGIVPTTWRDTMVAKGLSYSVDDGSDSTHPTLTLAAFGDAANRGIICLFTNLGVTISSALENWTVLGEITGASPTRHLWFMWNNTSSDASFAPVLSGSCAWAVLGSEMEQG